MSRRPFVCRDGLRDDHGRPSFGAQTVRRGGAGPVRSLLGGKPHRPLLFQHSLLLLLFQFGQQLLEVLVLADWFEPLLSLDALAKTGIVCNGLPQVSACFLRLAQLRVSHGTVKPAVRMIRPSLRRLAVICGSLLPFAEVYVSATSIGVARVNERIQLNHLREIRNRRCPLLATVTCNG